MSLSRRKTDNKHTAAPLWHRGPRAAGVCGSGRPASESGRLREATEGHPWGERRGEGLKLSTLRGGVSADVRGDGCSIQQIGVQLP